MPTLAFLGATGGTANAVLVLSLLSTNPTYHCRALARTPSKLLDSLKAKGVPETALARLTIIQGDAKDASAIARLVSPSSSSGKDVVETVIFGIGGSPVLQWSFTTPIGLDQPNICESSMAALLSALSSLPPTVPKPTVVAVSTTGLWAGIPREVPLLYGPFYTWLLHGPHMDKKGMEELLWADGKKGGEERRTGGFVIVRPTILTDAEEQGQEVVRWGGESNPAVGYTIGRKDVGRWIFERVVKGEGEGLEKDRAFTLSY